MDAAAIKAELDHPVIDADGHCLEYLPLLRELLVEEGGQAAGRMLDALQMQADVKDVPRAERRERRIDRSAWWGFPSENTLDRATSTLPSLFYERLDEFGIDFAVVYGTYGLFPDRIANEDFRRPFTRALNRYYAEVMFDHRDRMEPVAVIPMRTPEEALAELDFAVRDMGFKAIVMSGVIVRPIPGAEGIRGATWIDTVGHDSPYDYDPVWRRCVELGVAPTFHSLGSGWGSRTSSTNFVFNHIGHFATAQEAACRSIVMGGVAMRFPELNFCFLEGGVAWAANLCSDLIGHYDKRNIDAVQTYDPARLDQALLAKLVGEYGSPRVRDIFDRLGGGLTGAPGDEVGVDEMDEFAEARITDAEQIADLFSDRFYFGCEADDPMTAVAFDQSLPPTGRELQPVFASDIGHFDVRDAREVLPEAWELVEHGNVDRAGFRKFAFTNPARLWASQNPKFFDGTSVETAVRAELAL
jgi:predicted TIM-barrel fold metal-dependent hydrolase